MNCRTFCRQHGHLTGLQDIDVYFHTIPRLNNNYGIIFFEHGKVLLHPTHEALLLWRGTVWKSKCYGAFVLHRRVDLHAIDATPARWRGGAGSSPLDGASTAASSPRNDLAEELRHPTHG